MAVTFECLLCIRHRTDTVHSLFKSSKNCEVVVIIYRQEYLTLRGVSNLLKIKVGHYHMANPRFKP